MNKMLLITFLFLAGCNSQQNTGKPIKDSTTAIHTITQKDNALSPIASGCYAWHIKNDSALLQLNVSGNNVTGNLSYRLFEKDSNTGNIAGVIRDSFIIANYTFQSEGMKSVREVIFKINGDHLLEGFGDTLLTGDTAKFKNRAQLQFHDDRPFIKVTCK